MREQQLVHQIGENGEISGPPFPSCLGVRLDRLVNVRATSPRIKDTVIAGLISFLLAGCAAPAVRDAISDRPDSLRSANATFASVAALSSDSRHPPDDLRPILQSEIDRAGIPGIAAVVLFGDRIIAQGAAGVRRKGFATPVTIDDEFEICSCSKAMTATLVGLLVDEGKLRWDSPVSNFFADADPAIDSAWRQVTIWHLLTHRAGLRDLIGPMLVSTYFGHGSFTAQREKFAEKMLRHRPASPPGATFVYSSADYIVIAAILEKVTGESWERLMRERLFGPLAAASAGFGPPGNPGQLDQPWGHGKHQILHLDAFGQGGTAIDPGSGSADFPMVWAPAGLVHMSVPDWAKFAACHLRGDSDNPNLHCILLSNEAFARLHRAAPTEDYAGGWQIGSRSWAKGNHTGNTGRVLFHAGDNGRWNSVVWIAPEIDFAVLIASNRAHTWSAIDAIAGRLVGAYSPRARVAATSAPLSSSASP